jgi:hypothetical protein
LLAAALEHRSIHWPTKSISVLVDISELEAVRETSVVAAGPRQAARRAERFSHTVEPSLVEARAMAGAPRRVDRFPSTLADRWWPQAEEVEARAAVDFRPRAGRFSPLEARSRSQAAGL